MGDFFQHMSLLLMLSDLAFGGSLLLKHIEV